MKQVLQALILFLIAATSCEDSHKVSAQNLDLFSQEMRELSEYFHVPGMAILVTEGEQIVFEDYVGFADTEAGSKMDAQTCIPMASLTKIFTGVLFQQLLEEGKLSLDDPINKYLEEHPFPEEITLAHVLTHTSQGEPGEQFYYSYRFGALTSVLESASGQTFETLIQERILKKLDMDQSFLLKNKKDIKLGGWKVAQPYMWEGEVKNGKIEYGFSSSAGLVATLRDMAKFSSALDQHTLMSESALSRMFTPLKEGLPYGHGIFTQKIEGLQVYWGYGQYDAYSSLFLKIPERNLSLLLAANNNLLSDPARLIYGDVSYSLFALSFLKNIVLNLDGMPLLESKESLKKSSPVKSTHASAFFQKKLLAQALAESFLARYEPERMELSKELLDLAFSEFPALQSSADLTLMHGLSFLKTIDHHMELGGFEHFDQELEKVGKNLLKKDPNNPYANYYLANYFDMKGRENDARKHFNKILKAPNFSPFWYTAEAQNWLKDR